MISSLAAAVAVASLCTASAAPHAAQQPEIAGWDGVPASALVAADGTVRIVPRANHAALLAAQAFESDEAAWAVFNDTAYTATGWATLEVHTNPNMTNGQCATAAGVLEGKITAHRIYQQAVNSGLGPGLKPQKAMVGLPAPRPPHFQHASHTGLAGAIRHHRRR